MYIVIYIGLLESSPVSVLQYTISPVLGSTCVVSLNIVTFSRGANLLVFVALMHPKRSTFLNCALTTTKALIGSLLHVLPYDMNCFNSSKNSCLNRTAFVRASCKTWIASLLCILI